MNIIHRIGTKERSGTGDARILLTNKKGSYLCPGIQSDFDGLFAFDSVTEKMFKTLQDIHLDGEPDTIINHLSWAERKTGKATERFYLTSNAFIYDVENYQGEAHLTFDCKRLYDEGNEKRIYDMTTDTVDEHPILHIHYSKFLEFTPQYTRHVIVAAIPLNEHEPTIRQKGFWRKIDVPYDVSRGMTPERYVYDACTVSIKGPTRIIITSSSDYAKAKEKLHYILDNQDEVLSAIESYPQQRFGNMDDIEKAVAMNALDSLVTKRKHKASRGVYAGLPWFFQFWMRDEAISLNALMLQGQYALVKEILMRWMDTLHEHDIAALKGSTLATADGPGIVAKRLYELIHELKKQKQLSHFFTTEEVALIQETFTQYLATLRFRHGLVFSDTNETWMDTNPHDDGRAGFRIEIQTLTLCIYNLLIETSALLKQKNKEFPVQKKELLKSTKEWFYDQRGWLLDGFSTDGTVDIRTRTNIFLAWYYYPDLLEREEWKNAFNHALEKLWLPWGGLSSIGRDDPTYTDRDTGVDNTAYHHGDSWYFINNIAAMALFSIDPHHFHEYIEAIHLASTKDLFQKGFAGHATEICSAANQEARGCHAQAWSAATFIELVELLRS